jgi:hypothetical protein
MPHANAQLQAQNHQNKSLRVASHDIPAEPLPALPSSGTTSPGRDGRRGNRFEEHTRQQTPVASIPANLSSGASPELTMSAGASVYEPRAGHQTEQYQSQKWHHISEAFRSMSEKHKAIVAARIRLREERNSLRRQRETVVDLDIRLAGGLRDLFNKRPTEEISSLFALFEQLQSSRDELLRREDDFNIVEDELIGEEFDLQEAESRMFPGLPSGGSSFIDDQDIATYLEGLENPELDSGDGPEIQPPEMTQYFSRMGDADLIQESLDELRRERAHIVEEERVRRRLGLTLDKESQDFLNQFDHRHIELQDQLARVQEDLIKLQETLASDGDVGYTSSQFGNYDGPLNQAMEELEPLEVSDPDLLFPVVSLSLSTLPPVSSSSQKILVDASARSTDSLLLPDEDSSPVFPSPTGTSKPESIGIAAYINDWLLDMLRRSPREIHRLKLIDTFQQLQLNQVQLAKSVLGRWLDDEEAMKDFSKQELGARSLYISSNAAAKPARISKTLSLPELATRVYPPDGLRRLNAPLRRTTGITFRIQQHDRPSELDSPIKARSMYDFQPRSIIASAPRHFE